MSTVVTNLHRKFKSPVVPGGTPTKFVPSPGGIISNFAAPAKPKDDGSPSSKLSGLKRRNSTLTPAGESNTPSSAGSTAVKKRTTLPPVTDALLSPSEMDQALARGEIESISDRSSQISEQESERENSPTPMENSLCDSQEVNWHWPEIDRRADYFFYRWCGCAKCKEFFTVTKG